MKSATVVGCTLVLVLLPRTGGAALILETAQPAPVVQTSGVQLSDTEFLGARFSVAAPTQITSVGGAIVFNNSPLFAAIVKLDSATDVPVSGTHSSAAAAFDPADVVGTALFSGPVGNPTDVTVPLSVTIAPGNYLLAFGSGMFGATGSGSMPGNNPANFSQASLVAWYATALNPTTGQFDDWQWNRYPVRGLTLRFVIEGVAIPEPAMIVLLLGLVTILIAQRALCGRAAVS